MFNDSDRDKLKALSSRIGRAQDASAPKPRNGQGGADPLGRGVVGAVRLGSDFVALILGMAFFGWLADRQLDTAPWIMLVTITVGFVGGFWMLIRALVCKPADEGQDLQDETKE
ncbi:MAG: AtpZ/AtpI family protein [Alphaproteobacteria bacterium]|nr:AtpZ/AtpI family protein [Alphaproteobacteria bacterium]